MCNDVPQRGAATAVHQAALTLLDIEIDKWSYSPQKTKQTQILILKSKYYDYDLTDAPLTLIIPILTIEAL